MRSEEGDFYPCVLSPQRGVFDPAAFFFLSPLLHYHPLISLKLRSPRDPPAPCSLRSLYTGAAFAKTSTSLQSPKHVLTPHPCIVELKLSIVSPSRVSSTPPPPCRLSGSFLLFNFPSVVLLPKRHAKKVFVHYAARKRHFSLQEAEKIVEMELH